MPTTDTTSREGAGVAVEAAQQLTRTAIDCLKDVERALEQMAILGTCSDAAFGVAIAAHERKRRALVEIRGQAILATHTTIEGSPAWEHARLIIELADEALNPAKETPDAR